MFTRPLCDAIASRMKTTLLFAAALLLSHIANATEPVMFLVPTTDGLSIINGQIDIPDCGKEPLGAVVTDPYIAGSIVFTSYQWWKRWFTDDVSSLDNLKNFTGPIEYHNGSIDSQTPGLREKSILDASQIPMKSRPRFVLHEGVGHGLNNNPLYGPVEESIADQIVRNAVAWTQ